MQTNGYYFTRYPKPIRLVLHFLALLGLFFLITFFRGSLVLLIVGCIGLLFFSGTISRLGYLLITRQPLVGLSVQGILDNSCADCVGFIAWDEVQEVYITPIGLYRELKLVPKDMSQIMVRQNLYTRLVYKLLGFGYVTINLGSDVSLKGVLYEIRKHFNGKVVLKDL